MTVNDDSDNRKRDEAGRGPRRSGTDGEFRGALNRLENAVEDLVGAARGEASDRATEFVEEAAARLQREANSRRRSRGGRREHRSRSGNGSRKRERSQGHYGPFWDQHGYGRWPERSRRLYRDRENAKIVGVCAGIANYFGVERWVVRCAALTSLIFLPSITFPAYWIFYFMTDTPEKAQRRESEGRPRRRDARGGEADAAEDVSPVPEFGTRLSPRGSLRTVQADLNEIELKLRRMESHVTSDSYELQREIHKMESGSRAQPKPA